MAPSRFFICICDREGQKSYFLGCWVESRGKTILKWDQNKELWRGGDFKKMRQLQKRIVFISSSIGGENEIFVSILTLMGHVHLMRPKWTICEIDPWPSNLSLKVNFVLAPRVRWRGDVMNWLPRIKSCMARCCLPKLRRPAPLCVYDFPWQCREAMKLYSQERDIRYWLLRDTLLLRYGALIIVANINNIMYF